MTDPDAGSAADRPGIDAGVLAVLQRYLHDAAPPVPTSLLERGEQELRRQVAAVVWQLDPRVLDAVRADVPPDPPPGLLEAGLRAVADASAALGRPTPATAAVHRLPFTAAAALPAHRAVAAAGAAEVESVVVDDGTGRLRARVERRTSGVLDISITSALPDDASLVSIGWRGDGGDARRLLTPLAPSAGGAFVRYELEPGEDDDWGWGHRLEVTAPSAIDPGGAPVPEQALALALALATPLRGAALRAWRELLGRGGLDPSVAQQIREGLARYGTGGG